MNCLKCGDELQMMFTSVDPCVRCEREYKGEYQTYVYGTPILYAPSKELEFVYTNVGLFEPAEDLVAKDHRLPLVSKNNFKLTSDLEVPMDTIKIIPCDDSYFELKTFEMMWKKRLMSYSPSPPLIVSPTVYNDMKNILDQKEEE